jgi:hypothetical protein
MKIAEARRAVATKMGATRRRRVRADAADDVPRVSQTAAVDRPVAGPREQALLTRPIIGVATTYARPWATSAGWRPAMAAKAAGQRTATVKTVVTKVNRTWYEARAMSPSEIR